MKINNNQKYVGYSCAYTPLPLIHAAGFTPYRVFPIGDHSEKAGAILHDNLCPHIKRILDRAIAKDLPDLMGMVFMDSCESMRRLADSWRFVNKSDRQILVTLPLQANEKSIIYLSKQLKILAETLSEWSGHPIIPEAIVGSIRKYSELSRLLKKLEQKAAFGQLSRYMLQRVQNNSVIQPIEKTLSEIHELENHPPSLHAQGRAPIFLFGNVLPDPEVMALFEESGCLILEVDTCTGDRQHVEYPCEETEDPFTQLAYAMLNRPQCARTILPEKPGLLAKLVLESVLRSGAKGVVAHVMKFCDPYLARIPDVMAILREKKLPFLVLEGDCTMRSFGQHKTRIQAFAEMLT